MGRVMTASGPLAFEVLEEAECLRLLESGGIGRLGFSSRTLPVVLPVNFTLSDGAIVICTEANVVLSAAIANDVACLEIDDHEWMSHDGWSVLATGRLSEVVGEEDLASVRRLPLAPWRPMLDPHYVRLPIELVSGRRLRPLRGAATS